MKQQSKTTLFWSGLIGINSLFLTVFLWSLIPLGGETLPRVMGDIWDISFPLSALLVSLCCALLAAGSLGLMTLHPATEPAADIEQRIDRR
jgi:hypothetical protein